MIKVTVNNERTIYAKSGDNLFGLLTDNGFLFPGNCGGAGRCSKCQVIIDKESIPVKSCSYIVTEDINVTITSGNNMKVIAGEGALTDTFTTDSYTHYGVAVDIGTTTIAMELISISEDGTYRVLSSRGMLNPQIKYGADVIARIKKASDKTGLKILTELLYDALKTGITEMCSEISLTHKDIERISVFGNTAMLSIAAGITTENLGAYPFKVKKEMWQDYLKGDIIDDRLNAEVYIPPVISAFAGADIAGGACALDMDKCNSYNMLIDLGTNGEIILSGKGKSLCLSTACGPAFEEAFKKQGIFGSNICDMLTMLIKRKQIDKSGVIASGYFDTGINMGQGIIIDMDTVRSFQLAKAAIAAGIEIAAAKADIGYEDIDNIYIAGGFGFYLNTDSAMYLGMFPEEFDGRFKTVGNTSLKAAEMALINKDFDRRISDFTRNTLSINLAEEPDFNEIYIRHINF